VSDVRAAARRWAAAWSTGWTALDQEPILACYADDAVLSTEPFREPYRGRDGVRAYVTRVFSEEEDPRVRFAEPIVDRDRAAVAWWASLREDGADTTLAGTSILRFDDAGLVREQWDAWNVLDARREPPADGTPFRS
jgi:ketosteroid isomerase-like protein